MFYSSLFGPRSFSSNFKRSIQSSLATITEKRNRQMRDALNKGARIVINHCLDNQIGVIVFGWNQEQIKTQCDRTFSGKNPTRNGSSSWGQRRFRVLVFPSDGEKPEAIGRKTARFWLLSVNVEVKTPVKLMLVVTQGWDNETMGWYRKIWARRILN